MSTSTSNNPNTTPTILLILDGWGIYHPYNGNAISQAHTPNYDSFLKKYPNIQLQASGKFVGLPAHEDGNSEAGHLNIGAGRIVKQDTVTVSESIQDGTFFKNPAFLAAAKHVKKNKSDLHLMGLLTGWQSAHADPNHLIALLKFYRKHNIKNVYLHLFTDGRDSYQYGALKFLKHIQQNLQPHEKIASITGRYYAMDRTKNWMRTEETCKALIADRAKYYARSAEEAIQRAYDRGETDEFIIPTIIVNNGKCNDEGICTGGDSIVNIKDHDAIVFFNLRSDRARQLTKVFVQPDFNKRNPGAFKCIHRLQDLIFVSMTDFGPDLDSILTAFPSSDLKNTLPMALKGLRQLYIAETEKYAHITYFFNGGYADPVAGEDRKIIDSPKISSYDLKPDMSVYQITDEVLKNLQNKKYDFYAINFANPDMVGHTGNLTAGIKACQSVDECLGKIYSEIKKQKGVLIITSDHGNVEEMIDEKTGEVDTQHSSFPVPFIVIDKRHHASEKINLKPDGKLANIAPTILNLLNIEKPKEMTEKSLISQ